MKEFYGNYLGVVITGGDKDPEGRGRTQIFIPNIMPALYKLWNEQGEDISFEVIGEGLEGSLNPEILQRLQQVLPWAECAVPITGASPSYKPSVLGQASEVLRNVGSAVVDAGRAALDAGKAALGIDQVPPGDKAGLMALTDAAAKEKSAANYCGRGTKNILTGVFGYSKDIPGADGQNWGKNFESLKTTLPDGKVVNDFDKIPIKSPADAPPGSFLVYDSDDRRGRPRTKNSKGYDTGGSKSGHVEYKGADGKYYYGNTGNKPGGSVPHNFTGYAYVPRPHITARALQKLGVPTTNPSADAQASTTNMTPDPGTAGKNEEELTMSYDQQLTSTQSFGDQNLSLASGTGSGAATGFGSIDGVGDARSSFSGGKTAGGLPVINPADVKSTGSSQTRKVSVYGSVFSDFTTYLDVKPEQRSAEATEYWRNKGYNIEKQETQLKSRLPGWKPSLNIQDTGKGAFLGGQGNANLTPGFSIAVPSDNSYGLKPGSFVQIKNKAGEPIGPNNGYFQVADKGNSQNLKNLNAIDFYSGNDPELKKYFEGLSGQSTDLDVTPVEIGGESLAKLKESLNQQENSALAGTTFTDTTGLAGSVAGQPTIKNPTSHPGVAGPNTNNQALGMFGYASEGQAVWVFFREGNPLFPVYFAASYGQKEWASMFGHASPGVGAGVTNPQADGKFPSAPGAAPTGAIPGTEASQWNSYGGGIRSAMSTDESPLGTEFLFQLYGKNGSHFTFLKDHTEFYSPYDHVSRVMADHQDITEANKEVRVRGDYNTYAEQDLIISVGNWSQEAIDASDEIQKYINEAMKIKTEAGNS